MKRLYAVRGAVCSENTKEDISKNVHEMCDAIFTENGIKSEDLVSIQFTMTKDLDEYNACAALRKSGPCIDCSQVALFCSQEAEIKGMLPKCIRVMITCYLEEGKEIRNIYMNGAEVLRPDRK